MTDPRKLSVGKRVEFYQLPTKKSDFVARVDKREKDSIHNQWSVEINLGRIYIRVGHWRIGKK